ncbi:TfoX/Sxy family transcriptional regulator [Sporomusaceae bacterium BoRhaA]|uniref:hypothetical protein n=1 Tax=Pelorhabdus rhamnosifermentans TaxID=2772457 RepID=UPI001C0627F2|nr:hypothetical protein [Pelorhabdus rhamnosifermentans]MBU2700371.1 TfoX/Sxy family transcriptional regulator [Pelorhabdus rhamnosifermentans]
MSMFDMKSIVKAIRVHDITMLALEKSNSEWDYQDEQELTRAIVAKYDSINRLVLQDMKYMERISRQQARKAKNESIKQ